MVVYKEIKIINDQNDLQKDLNSLQVSTADWDMRFNACNILSFSKYRCDVTLFVIMPVNVYFENYDEITGILCFD